MIAATTLSYRDIARQEADTNGTRWTTNGGDPLRDVPTKYRCRVVDKKRILTLTFRHLANGAGYLGVVCASRKSGPLASRSRRAGWAVSSSQLGHRQARFRGPEKQDDHRCSSACRSGWWRRGHPRLNLSCRIRGDGARAGRWSLTSLREKLIKIGAKVVSHGRS